MRKDGEGVVVGGEEGGREGGKEGSRRLVLLEKRLDCLITPENSLTRAKKIRRTKPTFCLSLSLFTCTTSLLLAAHRAETLTS